MPPVTSVSILLLNRLVDSHLWQRSNRVLLIEGRLLVIAADSCSWVGCVRLIEALHLDVWVGDRLLICLTGSTTFLIISFIEMHLEGWIFLSSFLNQLKVIVSESPLRRGRGLASKATVKEGNVLFT